MIVHRTALAYIPADGEEFVELGLVDEVAGVVLAVPGQIGGEAGLVDRHLFEQ